MRDEARLTSSDIWSGQGPCLDPNFIARRVVPVLPKTPRTPSGYPMPSQQRELNDA
jgi:hypothetical protein